MTNCIVDGDKMADGPKVYPDPSLLEQARAVLRPDDEADLKFDASLHRQTPGRPASRGRSAARIAGALVLAALLSGCTRAPAITLFGATFPGWLFCLAGGVLATVIIHLALQGTVGVAWLKPLPVSYVGLFGIFSVLIWLAFFYR